MINAWLNNSSKDLDSLWAWQYYLHYSVLLPLFCITSPSFGTRSFLSPTLSVSHPRSLSHSVPLAASGCLTAVPLPMCQGAHWTDNTNLMYVRGCVRAWRCALGVCSLHMCVWASECVTCYKCLSCPFLCAHSPKHPLLHLQSGPRATILTAEAGREGQLKHHTHTHTVHIQYTQKLGRADGRMWPLSQWHFKAVREMHGSSWTCTDMF